MIKNIIIILLFCACGAFAQEFDSEYEVIKLEPLEIVEEKERQPGTEITREDMDKTGIQDLQQALGRVPGVTLSDGGSRGDSSFSIRGFDSTYIPIIVDGISVSSPFNGRGDSGSLLTGDMERVIVQKGYSTMLMGANGMGGAVLLTTAKPKDTFEGYLRASLTMDDEFDMSAYSTVASLGTRQDKFYAKGTIQFRNVEHIRLPGDYKPMQGSVQDKGKRLFSDRDDLKATVIAGITPISGLDIWTTYIYQTSDRGMNPPEIGPVYSLWGWDNWDHQSISLHGEYNNNKWNIGILAFYDTYNNTLSSYSSFTHVDIARPNRTIEYDEFAFGSRLNADYKFNNKHTLRGAFSFRQDDHWSYRNDLPNKNDIHVRENKISLALEHDYQPLERLRFLASIGFDSLLPEAYWSRSGAFADYMGVSEYQVDEIDRWLLAAQAGVFYEVVPNHELRLTYARRNQFPTMNDRYATRFGDYRPNPNLKPEVADHIEFGYKGLFFYKVAIDAALYYSHISDKMAVIKVSDPFNSSHAVDFTTNLDAVSFYGFEFASTLFLSDYIEMGANLSLSNYSVDESLAGAKVVPYHPKVTANGYIEFIPWKKLSIMPLVEYRGKRWLDVYENRSLDSYFLLHLYLAYSITDDFKINVSVQNVMDELYELRRHYPQQGRTYSLDVSVKF